MIIKFILVFLYFILLNILFFILPGLFIIGRFKLKLSYKKKLLLGEVLGLLFFTLLTLLLKLFHLSLNFYYLIVFLSFWQWWSLRPKLKINFSYLKKEKLTLFLILSGTIIQNIPLLFGGLKDKEGNLVFTSDWAYHDFSWHIALIEELKRQVPPLNPVYKAQALKDYHYFYDLLLASFHQLSGINILDLLYRFFLY